MLISIAFGIFAGWLLIAAAKYIWSTWYPKHKQKIKKYMEKHHITNTQCYVWLGVMSPAWIFNIWILDARCFSSNHCHFGYLWEEWWPAILITIIAGIIIWWLIHVITELINEKKYRISPEEFKKVKGQYTHAELKNIIAKVADAKTVHDFDTWIDIWLKNRKIEILDLTNLKQISQEGARKTIDSMVYGFRDLHPKLTTMYHDAKFVKSLTLDFVAIFLKRMLDDAKKCSNQK